jgi:phosphatidylglycerol:prolipoprotein diacylglycerol transferase
VWPSIVIPIVNVSIAPYEVVRVVAIIVCIGLATALNARQGIAPRTAALLALVAAGPGVLTARLLDMLEYHSEISLSSLWAHGGSSIYGAFLGGVLTLAIVARLVGVPVLAYLDGAAPALSLSEAITRIGCFAAGCCYGVPWNGPWAVVFPQGSFAVIDLEARGVLPPGSEHSPPLHPVQLYSAAIMFGVTAYLLYRFRRRAFQGEGVLMFLIAYGTLRLAVAPFRTEVLASMKSFSIAFIAVGIVGIAWKRFLGRVAIAPARPEPSS